MRSSLAQEISAFAVAVSRRPSPLLFLFSLYFAFQLPRGMEETAERREAGGEESEKAGTGKARGQKIVVHVTAVSTYSRDPKAKPK